MRGVRIGLTSALILAAALGAAPAALANTTKSTNWAGYAIHRAGVSFRQVSASWVQPTATCATGRPTYSAAWVGLGGFQPTSDALEQIGTEVDCTAAGRASSSTWYELVPAPSRPISLPVAPGDLMHATVTVTGHRVVVELDNLTQHRRFRKTVYVAAIDTSSAEWIVEAPSACVSQSVCQALPLADFGSITFSSATAKSATGSVGTIANGSWNRTKVNLTAGGQRFLVDRGTSDTTGTASPSALRSGGSVFDVTYATATVSPSQYFGRQARPRAAYLQH